MTHSRSAPSAATLSHAARLHPDSIEAQKELAGSYIRHGRLQEAMVCWQRVAAQDPNDIAVWSNLGNALRESGRAAEAVPVLQHAVRLKPDYLPAQVNLGAALEATGDLPQAEAHFRVALRLAPADVRAGNNLGNVLQKQGRLDEALACLGNILRREPNFAEAHNVLGAALEQMGRWEAALASYERAVALKPELADAHVNRAMAWLMLEDFERGWAEYEWRLRGREVVRPRAPRWRGEPLEGKTIRLSAEQGLGDSIQFIRYARLVRARGARVVVECPSRLVPLFAGVAGVDWVCAAGGAAPRSDFEVPLMSLPGIFGTRLDTIPAPVPYVGVDAGRVAHWKQRIGDASGRIRVGLAWAGNPNYSYNRRRSLRLADFAGIAALDNVKLFSLQRGPQASELRNLPPGFEITNLEDEGNGILDTAAAMMNLDLVISVDSLPAHLSGALGRPVWLLLPLAPDWRWLRGREDTPWYPGMRLFRQRTAGDWRPLVTGVAAQLRAGEFSEISSIQLNK